MTKMTNKSSFYKVTAILVLLVTFMLSACGGSDQNGTKTSNSTDCLSKGKTMKEDERITAKLTTGDTYEDTEKRTFTVEELADYHFGVDGKETKDGYYAVFELCNLDTNKYAYQDPLYEEDLLWYINTTEGEFGAYNETSAGNLTKFYHITSDDEEVSYIEKAGNYAVNVFRASEELDWVWVASLEFTVE